MAAVKKKLTKLDALVSQSVRFVLTGSQDPLASYAEQCLSGSFPWRTLHRDRALHAEIVLHLRLYFLVNR